MYIVSGFVCFLRDSSFEGGRGKGRGRGREREFRRKMKMTMEMGMETDECRW